MRELANWIAIKSLSRKSIEAYLSDRAKEIFEATTYDYKTVADFIFGVYDLQDLVQRPLLLSMVVSTVICGSIDISKKELRFGPSELYDFYTTACAQRDTDKGGIVPFLNTSDRLLACRQLAVSMFNNGTIVLSNEQILTILGQIQFETPRPRDMSMSDFIQRALTDIRVCSFLTMDENNSLKFSHTSFMEFFFRSRDRSKMRVRPWVHASAHERGFGNSRCILSSEFR